MTLTSQAARFVFRFGSIIVLARLLTPQQFGLVAMATTVVGIAEIIRDCGLSSAAIQSRTLSNQERTNLFWVNVVIGTGCAVLAVLASRPIALFYGDDRVQTIVLALAGLMIISGANTQFRADLSRSLSFRALAITDVSAQALSVGVAIGAAALGAGYWALVMQQAALVALTFLGNVLQCRWRPGWYARSVSIRQFLRYGGGVMGTQMIGYATNNVDNLAIGAVWGAAQLGLYSRAYQLLMAPLEQVDRAMTSVVLSVLSKVRDDRDVFIRYLCRVQLVNSYLLGTGFAILAGVSVPLVSVIFGPEWAGIAPIFAILAVGGIFRALTQVAYWIFLVDGLTGRQLRLYLVTRPFMIGLIVAGLPWGAIGVAVGHSVAFLLYWFVSLWRVSRAAQLDVRPLLHQALRSLALVTVPAGLVSYAASLPFDNVIVGCLAGVFASAGYIGILVMLSRRERAEAVVIRNILRRALSRRAA